MFHDYVGALPTRGELDSSKGGEEMESWLLAHPGVVPIPGSKMRTRVEENVRATDVHVTPGDLAEIGTIFPPGVAAGSRYPPAAMASVHK